MYPLAPFYNDGETLYKCHNILQIAILKYTIYIPPLTSAAIETCSPLGLVESSTDLPPERGNDV